MRIPTYSLILDEDTRIPALVKDTLSNYPHIRSLAHPSDIVVMLNEIFHMNCLPEEHVVLIGTDFGGKVIAVFALSHGNVCQAAVGIRETFMRLLMCGAARFILAHCHPSGDPTPSVEDDNVTKRLSDAGDLMEVHFVDHIIIAGNTYYSYHEAGKLPAHHA